MTALTFSPVVDRPAMARSGEAAPLAAPRTRPGRVRPSRGSGRGRTPNARPRTGVAAPQLQRAGVAGSRGCVGEAPGWRLTERGIAVVLVTGLLLAVAAVVAIVSTAITVTSEDYRPPSSVAVGR